MEEDCVREDQFSEVTCQKRSTRTNRIDAKEEEQENIQPVSVKQVTTNTNTIQIQIHPLIIIFFANSYVITQRRKLHLPRYTFFLPSSEYFTFLNVFPHSLRLCQRSFYEDANPTD